SVEVMPHAAISFFASELHLPFGFETETTQIGKQMPEDLELVGDRKAIELQHDLLVKRRDVAVPDVARNTGEVDGGKSTFETARHRHFRNAVTLPQILAQKKGIDAGGVTAHDHVLIVVGENLRLDEIARA